jgi:hypothetical protein
MASHELTEQDWAARLFVYEFMIGNMRPPSIEEIGARFQLSHDDARATLHRLNDAHMLLLHPGADDIQMAHPLSGIPTPFRVYAGDQLLYANCAWDTLGIAAMVKRDVQVEAVEAFSGEAISYQVVDGDLQADDDLLVNYALPFAQWYDDLIHT